MLINDRRHLIGKVSIVLTILTTLFTSMSAVEAASLVANTGNRSVNYISKSSVNIRKSRTKARATKKTQLNPKLREPTSTNERLNLMQEVLKAQQVSKQNELGKMKSIILRGKALVQEMDSTAWKLVTDNANQVFGIKFKYIGVLNKYIGIYNNRLNEGKDKNQLEEDLAYLKGPAADPRDLEDELKYWEEQFYKVPLVYYRSGSYPNIYILPSSDTQPQESNQQMCSRLQNEIAISGGFGSLSSSRQLYELGCISLQKYCNGAALFGGLPEECQ